MTTFATATVFRFTRARIELLFDALVDPASCERTMGLLLLGYISAWTAYALLAQGAQDIHVDMGELVAWSRETGLGTPKHPPLAVWLVEAWFSVFPLRDWAYDLLAVLVPTAGLWMGWQVSARYLSPDKRVIGVVLLTLVPFYNFHALKLNANTVLIPLWAATTFWFLRSLETRRAGWAVLAGVGAAASMLGKYWSIVLIVGLGLSALTDPRRGAYFRSAAPWLTIAVGIILLMPHAVWVIAHNFQPLRYAVGVHEATLAAAAKSSFVFLAGSLGYIVAPIVLSLLAVRPDWQTVGDVLWPRDAERRAIVVMFAAPLFVAALAAVVLQVKIVSLWSMAAMTLLPVVLLSSPRVTISRDAGVRFLALAVGFPLFMVAISPAIAFVMHRRGVRDYGGHYRLIAQAVDRAWRARTDKPLRIVGSDPNPVNGVIFYLPSRPSTFSISNTQLTPWINADRIGREGIAMVCPEVRADCIRAMDAIAGRYPAATSTEITLARRYLGVSDTPVLYRIVIIPP